MSARILEPATAAELADMMRQCAADGTRVLPAGSMTWLGTAAGDADAVVISTRTLTDIEAYEPEDLTITAAAGVTLAALRQATGAHGQWLALDPPAADGATLGAAAATASAGPGRALYGTPRDYVLGLDIVTGDGRLLHFGGRVVKNVAGYDLVRPIVGSFGRLGIVTSVSIRLRPVPAADETVAWKVPIARIAEVAAKAARLWPVAACEILSPALASSGDGDWVLLVRLHGHPAECVEARRRLAAGLLLEPMPEVTGHVWDRLCAQEAAAAPYFRLAATPSRLERVLEIANRLADHTLAGPPAMAIHASDGIVRLWGTSNGEPPRPAAATAAADIADIDGTCSYVDGSAPGTAADGRRADLDRGIRALFDPAGILPPWPT